MRGSAYLSLNFYIFTLIGIYLYIYIYISLLVLVHDRKLWRFIILSLSLSLTFNFFSFIVQRKIKQKKINNLHVEYELKWSIEFTSVYNNLQFQRCETKLTCFYELISSGTLSAPCISFILPSPFFFSFFSRFLWHHGLPHRVNFLISSQVERLLIRSKYTETFFSTLKIIV